MVVEGRGVTGKRRDGSRVAPPGSFPAVMSSPADAPALLRCVIIAQIDGKVPSLTPGPINADLFLHAKMHHRIKERAAGDEMTMRKTVRKRLRERRPT